MLKIANFAPVLFSLLFATSSFAADIVPSELVSGKSTVLKVMDSGEDVTKNYDLTQTTDLKVVIFSGKPTALGQAAGQKNIIAKHTSGDSTKDLILPVTVLPGVAVKLIIDSGNYQKGAVSEQLPLPLKVKAVDNANNGVGGVEVSFTSSVADSVISPATLSTDSDGIASVEYTLGSVAKNESITASGPSSLSKGKSVVFTQTATKLAASAPAKLTISVPSSADANKPFPSPVSVSIYDASGAIYKTESKTVTIAAFKNSSCSLPTTIQGTISKSSSEGVSSFSDLKAAASGFLYIKASVDGIPSVCSSQIAVKDTAVSNPSAHVPITLNYTSIGTSYTAGLTFNPQIKLQLLDDAGKVYNKVVPVDIRAYSDSECSVDVTPSLVGVTRVNSSFGNVTYTALSYPEAKKIYVQASYSPYLSACAPIDIIPDANKIPASLKFSSFSTTGTANQSLSSSPKVSVLNSKGYILSSPSVDVSLSAFSDSSCLTPATGTLSSEPTTATSVNGVASFSKVSYSTEGAIYIKAQSESFSVCSQKITIAPPAAGAPAKLVITQSPAGEYQLGDAMSSPLKVEVRDSNNSKTSFGSVSVSLGFFSDSACSVAVTSPAGQSSSSVSGIASFSVPSPANPGDYFMKVSSGTLIPACSLAINVKAPCPEFEHYENGACVPNVKMCAISNGAGEMTYSNGTWGSCIAQSCDSNFTKTADESSCAPDLCTTADVSNSLTVSGYRYDNSCIALSCAEKYMIESNSCVSAVPGTPTLLSATMRDQAGNVVTDLTWTSVPGATYEVYRGTSPDSLIHQSTTSETSHTDSSTLSAGVDYFYAVKANANTYSSEISNVLEAKFEIQAPVLTAEVVDLNSAKLRFNQVSGVDGYDLYKKTNSGTFAKQGVSFTLNGSQYEYVDADVAQGNSYTYYVKAVVGDGSIFADSNEETVSFGPEVPVISSYYGDPEYNALSWAARGSSYKEGLSYEVFRSTDNNNFTLIGSPSVYEFADSNRVDGQAYFYKVRAVENGIQSNFSEVVQIKHVTAFTVKVKSMTLDSVTIEWTNAIGADNYKVFYGAEGTWDNEISSATSPFTITGLTTGPVRFQVYAENSHMGFSWSEEMMITIAEPSPEPVYSKMYMALSVNSTSLLQDNLGQELYEVDDNHNIRLVEDVVKAGKGYLGTASGSTVRLLNDGNIYLTRDINDASNFLFPYIVDGDKLNRISSQPNYIANSSIFYSNNLAGHFYSTAASGEAGQTFIKDASGERAIFPMRGAQFIDFNGKVYFLAGDGGVTNPYQIVSYSPAAGAIIENVIPTSTSTNVSSIQAFKDRIIVRMVVSSSFRLYELKNGSLTMLPKNAAITSEGTMGPPTVFGSPELLGFSCTITTATLTTAQAELCIYDGIQSYNVLNVNANTSGTQGSSPTNLNEFQGKLIMSATITTSGSTQGGQEFVVYTPKYNDLYNMTNIAFKDLNNSSAGSSPGVPIFGRVNGVETVAFMTSTTLNLWTGTIPITTTTIASVGASNNMAISNNRLYYNSSANASYGSELYVYDFGTGQTVIHDLITGTTGSQAGKFFVLKGNELHFAAILTGDNYYKIMKIDTSSFESKPRSIEFFTNFGLSPSWMGAINGTIFIKGSNLSTKNYFHRNVSLLEMFSYDGVSERVTNLNYAPEVNGTIGGNGNPVIYKGKIYANLELNGKGSELVEMDGVNPPVVYDIIPGSAGSNPFNLAVVKLALPGSIEEEEVLVFSASNGTDGWEPFIFRGTGSPTMIKDINPGSASGSPTNFTSMNGKIYFYANTAANSYELYKSDGTDAGTVMISDLNPGTGTGGNYSKLHKIQTDSNDPASSKLCFIGMQNTSIGKEIYCTDGETIYLVKDIHPTAGGVSNDFTSDGKRLIFSAWNGTKTQVWISYGTEAGTFPAADYMISSSYPGYTQFNNRTYFTCSITGSVPAQSELCYVNGDDTVGYHDIYVGGNGDPRIINSFNGRLYFSAFDSMFSSGGVARLYTLDKQDNFQPVVDPVLGNVNTSSGIIPVHGLVE